MSDEVKSIFDGFEIDEKTGEVIIPRATVGVAKDESKMVTDEDGVVSVEGEYIPALTDEELPELKFDFEFGEEEFADPTQDTEEDIILQNIDEALAAQMAVSLGPVEELQEEEMHEKKKSLWKRIPMWCRVSGITLCSLCLILVFLIGTAPGRRLIYKMVAGYVSDGVTRPDDEEPNTTYVPTEDDIPMTTKAPDKDNPSQGGQSNVTIPSIDPRKEEHVYNILLIGVEALPQFGGNRSDTMILISINEKTKKIYMTSLMRDMYVQIPGYTDNKLNAAFNYGGAQLLIDAVELNLRVKIDGYVRVGFDSFEWIVDRLGGVEITLTAQEAEYLRKTNYISNPNYRNVVAGNQKMNGNQVLGYCRVRYVPTANGTYSDFGRTERQRSVLNKIFEKYKSKDLLTLVSIFNDCLPRVITDISKGDMEKLMEMVVENRILNLVPMRVPMAGTFTDATVGKSEVIRVDWEKNIEKLHGTIFSTGE